jgi:hypothetical protein
MPYMAPLEARYDDPAGRSHKIEKTWDFGHEPYKGEHIQLTEELVVTIVDVDYENNDDAYAKRAYVCVDVSGFQYLLATGWQIRE